VENIEKQKLFLKYSEHIRYKDIRWLLLMFEEEEDS